MALFILHLLFSSE